MLARRVTEPSSSSLLSPVVLVSKPGGGKRFCVNFRGVNRVTRDDVYPLPRIEELLDSVSGAKY